SELSVPTVRLRGAVGRRALVWNAARPRTEGQPGFDWLAGLSLRQSADGQCRTHGELSGRGGQFGDLRRSLSSDGKSADARYKRPIVRTGTRGVARAPFCTVRGFVRRAGADRPDPAFPDIALGHTSPHKEARMYRSGTMMVSPIGV